MKTKLVGMALLSIALWANAQDSKITDLSNAHLTWTNTTTNVYSSLMFTFDLAHSWHPVPSEVTWNRLVTNDLMNWDFPMDLLLNLSVSGDALYYRIQSCEQKMSPPHTTNLLGFSNSTQIPVSNLYLDYSGDVPSETILIPLLLPGTTNAWHAFVVEDLVSVPTGPVPLVEGDVSLIRGHYEISGDIKPLELSFEYFCPPQFKRIVRIGANGYSVE